MASQEQDGRTNNAFPESGADDDEEYDSDSEGTSALALRRREASDDDEDHQEPNVISRRPRFYEEDAEDEGAAPVEEEEEEDYEDAVDGDRPAENGVEDDEEVSQHHREGVAKNAGSHAEGTVKQGPAGSKGAEDKKDAEPFVVPTAGAFYMHDDRFRYNEGVRPRAILAQFTPEQMSRYECYRRSGFQKANMRRLLQSVAGCPISMPMTIVMSGIAKMFVGELVEIGRIVMTERKETGPIRPCHIREAYRRLKLKGKVPARTRPRLFH